MQRVLESRLISIIKSELEVSLDYERVSSAEVEVERYKTDPVFSLFLLNSKDVVLARARGALVMSITRKLGDLYEKSIKEIVKHQLGLTDAEIRYSARIAGEERSLECRILLKDIKDENIKVKVKQLMNEIILKKREKYERKTDFAGLGFEIRYCYQIGDSKRIQADLHMARNLFKNDILPIMLIFCSTSLQAPVRRFRESSYWTVIEGIKAYSFIERLSGFNFYSFLKDDKDARSAIRFVMDKLLAKFRSERSHQITL